MERAALSNTTWQVLKTYLFITKKNRSQIFLIFLGFSLASVLELTVVKYNFKNFIDTVIGIGTVEHKIPQLITIGITIIIARYLTHVCAGFADFKIAKTETANVKLINDYCFSVLDAHSYTFYADSFIGSLVAKVKRFSSVYTRILPRMLFNFWLSFLDLTIIITVAWFVSFYLGLFFTCWLLIYLLAIFWFARFKQPYHGLVAKTDSRVTGALADAIGNFLAVKVFAASSREQKRFTEQTEAQRLAAYSSEQLDCYFRTFQAFSVSGLELAGMGIVVYLWTQDIVTAGTIVLMQSYFTALTGRLWELRRAIVEFFKDISDADEMVTILTTPPSVQDPRRPKKITVTKGVINFNKITFGYANTPPLFKELQLQIKAKQHVGIVGTSGAGKSTLFKLLLRFVDVQQGTISIDNQDIRKSTQSSVRSQFGYVSQEPYLFHRSLYENIAYGKPTATLDEVIKAAKKANAHTFIQRLPNGYNTLVGERGVKLSGGERQRVALARIILHDAPILLLDEATSALDSVSERYIQDHLQTVMQGKTALVIAHRISTIQQLDRIIVLEHGTIVEDGTHVSLLRKNGVYATLWNHQSDGFIGIE